MRLLPLVAALLASGSAASADDPGVSLTGSGILTLPDTTTLAPGRLTVALTLDNHDRDPLGLDIFDYAVAFGVGVTSRLEAYGRHVASRVVSLPERPILPPPPLDLVVAGGAAPPPGAIHSFYAPAPYVRRSGRFERFLPGDTVLGSKLRVAEPKGPRPGLALGAELKLPLSEAPNDLASGAGTGSVDATARAVLEWRVGRAEVVASTAYTLVGEGALGDRTILVTADAATAADTPLRLPDRLDLGLGIRGRLSKRVALFLEGVTSLDVGARTPVLDARAPLDGLGGLQLRLGHARVTAGLRYHGRALPSGALRDAPLAGGVDLTDVAPDALAAYLQAHDAGAALPHLRPGSQRVLLGAGGAPLPDGARRIPPRYPIRSEHQLGFALVVGWAF
ncbi:MAG: hypothetical protein HY317_06070 [Acidobacteria bacterium]|nr:hypothetical protein [Acidobacteriota bacterium]